MHKFKSKYINKQGSEKAGKQDDLLNSSFNTHYIYTGATISTQERILESW